MDLCHSTNSSSSSSGVYNSKLIIDSKEFTIVVKKLRDFFFSKNFVEAHPQNRLSILAACEDPFTVATFNYAGQIWPLPQTGQMWLEYELLKNPTPPGYFCSRRTAPGGGAAYVRPQKHALPVGPLCYS